MTRNGTVKIIIVAMLVLSGAGFVSVSHAALKTWSSPGPDSLWSTPGNWTPPGVPTNTDSVVFEDTSSVNCRNVFGAVYAMTLATGYSGTVTIGVSMNLSTEPGGNLTIGSGTFKGTDGHLTVGGNVVITGGTFTIPDQAHNFLVGGGWNKTGGAVTWDATAKVKFIASTPGHVINLGTPGGGSDIHALCFDGSGGGWIITSDIATDSIWFDRGSLNLGTGRTLNTYVFNCTSNLGALAFGSSTLNIVGNTARFEVASIDHGTGIMAFTGATGVQGLYSSTDTLPNIVHSGASTLQLEGANSLRCKSFSNTAGRIALNSNDITTFGDFRIVGGNSSTFVPATLNSRKFYIRGKALFQGSASSLLNFNATPYCSLKVADTLIADYASVSGIFPTTDSTMGGLYKGMAAITSRDDGNNGTGWVFPFSRITSTLLDSLKDGAAALYFDIDNNGQLDLFTSGFNKLPYERRNKIMWNSGASFNTSLANVDSMSSGAVAAADYDNDGDIDFAEIGSNNAGGQTGRIYRNNGAGSFTNVYPIQGMYWGSLDWGDYDNDGDLDLLAVGNTNSNGFCAIYRNDGSDVFTQQSSSFPAIKKGTARFGDYNNDGLVDVLVSGENYAGSTRYTKIYRNYGTYFSDEFAALPQVAGPSNWVDYDSDGDLDVFVNGYDGSAWMARLYQNSSGSFTHVSSAIFNAMYGGAQTWTDFNGDGKPDLTMNGQLAAGGDTVTVLYRNNANGTFTDLQAALPGLAGGALAWGDVNSDSTPDLYMTGALKGGNGSAFPQILKNNLKIITGFVKPTVPAGLSASVSKDTVIFSWGSSTTSFGPATYNLRAGIGNKMDSLVSGMVTANTGLVAQAGNSGFTTSRKVRSRIGSGWYKYQVQAVDNRLVRSAFSAPESIYVDATPPTVTSATLTQPNGGQVLIGPTYSITWNSGAISDNHLLKNNPVTLQYSSDSLASFTTIISNISNSGSYSWTVPIISSTKMFVRIMVADSAGNVAYDTSNAKFILDAIPPVVASSFITRPNGGEIIRTMVYDTIRWNNAAITESQLKNPGPLSIQLSTDGGTTWSFTINAAYDTAGGKIAWMPTGGYAGTALRIRIGVSDSAGNVAWDTSNANFSLDHNPPTVSASTILKPNGGETVKGSSTTVITWDTAAISDNVRLKNLPVTLLFSRDAGTTFTDTIIKNIANTGLYTWATICTSTVNMNVKIVVTDSAGFSAQDVSDSRFTLDCSAPTVAATAITYPNGGEYIAGGSTQTITWTPGDILDNRLLRNAPISLTLCQASNDAVVQTIASTVSNGGIYASWTVPMVGGNYKIKLTATDSAGNTQYDLSNAAFVIDTGAPGSASISITDNNGYTNDSMPLVTISANSADSMRLTLDTTLTVVWQAYAVSRTVAIERGGDGTKRIWAQFKDRAGNRSAWISDATVLDRVAPAALPVMSSLYNKINWKDSLQGTVIDERSGVAGVTVIVTRLSDNAHWDTKNNYWIPQMQEYAATGIASWNTVLRGIALADGQYMVSAYATDNAGNVQTNVGSAVFQYYAVPQARYIPITVLSGAAPFSITLTDSSSGAIDSRIYSWGDGRSDTVKTLSGALQHIYANKGSYTAGLVVSGPGGSDTLVNSNYVIVSDTTRPVNPTNIRTIALSSSTAKISWSPVAISDIKDVAICFSTKGTWQNGDSITAAVADTAQGLILVKYVDVKKIVDTIINLPDYGVRLYVSAFARDSSGNLALFDNTAADTIVLPDGRAPQNTITATLTNKGDSTVTVKFVTSKTIATDAVRIDAYASTGALSIDSASPLLSFFKRLSYKDTAFSVRVIDKPGTWYFAYVLVDSNGNKTIAYVDTQKIANMAPAFVSHPDVTIKQSLSYLDSVQAADRNGDGLVYRLLVAPKEMAMATASRTLVWSVTQRMSVGSNQIVVECTDGRGGVALDTFIIHVIVANELPRTYLKQKQQAYGALSYRIGAQDLNDSIFTFTDTLLWIDSSRVIAPTVTSMGVFTYYPLMDGTYRFSCRAMDAKGAGDSMLYVDTARISGATKHTFADTAAWHMLSVPAMAMATDSLKRDGAVMHWDETGNERNLYQYYSSATQTMPGKAYWRKAGRTAPVQLMRSQLVRDTAVTIALAKGAYGWNQIASPYVYPVKVTNVPNLWKWNADSADYMLAGNAVLEPWQGYWAMVDTARTVVIPATPVYNGVSMLAKRQMPYFTSRSEWQVRFSLQLPGGVDGENRIGFSRSARNGFDNLDLCEPPRPDGKSSAFIYHPEWKVADGRFASDIRIDWEEINVFQIGIAPGSQNANLSFSGVSGLSGIYMYILSGDSLMRLDDKISVAVNTGSEMLYKTVFASSRSDLQATLPMAFTMRSPMPNPVRQSARIGYSLPYTWAANGLLTARAYDVSIRIYDVSGRIVRDVMSRRQDAGTYSVIWDGKSNNGRFIAAGNYYCRIVAGKYTAIKNVIVVR